MTDTPFSTLPPTSDDPATLLNPPKPNLRSLRGQADYACRLLGMDVYRSPYKLGLRPPRSERGFLREQILKCIRVRKVLTLDELRRAYGLDFSDAILQSRLDKLCDEGLIARYMRGAYYANEPEHRPNPSRVFELLYQDAFDLLALVWEMEKDPAAPPCKKANLIPEVAKLEITKKEFLRELDRLVEWGYLGRAAKTHRYYTTNRGRDLLVMT